MKHETHTFYDKCFTAIKQGDKIYITRGIFTNRIIVTYYRVLRSAYFEYH